jgi:hypothetical protein
VAFRPRLTTGLAFAGNGVPVDVTPAGRLTKMKWSAPAPIFRKKNESPLGNPVIFSSLKETRGLSSSPPGEFNFFCKLINNQFNIIVKKKIYNKV